MEWSFVFFLNSALLGVGLAMDAFSVSLANGLHDPYMSRRRGAIIAGHLWRFSGRYAHGGLALRPHHRGVILGL